MLLGCLGGEIGELRHQDDDVRREVALRDEPRVQHVGGAGQVAIGLGAQGDGHDELVEPRAHRQRLAEDEPLERRDLEEELERRVVVGVQLQDEGFGLFAEVFVGDDVGAEVSRLKYVVVFALGNGPGLARLALGQLACPLRVVGVHLVRGVGVDCARVDEAFQLAPGLEEDLGMGGERRKGCVLAVLDAELEPAALAVRPRVVARADAEAQRHRALDAVLAPVRGAHRRQLLGRDEVAGRLGGDRRRVRVAGGVEEFELKHRVHLGFGGLSETPPLYSVAASAAAAWLCSR